MALVTINGVTVLNGTVLMPLVGIWTADLVIDQPNGQGFDAGTKVTISSADGFELSGVVAPDRTGDFLDAVHVRVLGGAGGMAKTATPRSYVQPSAFVRDVLSGLARDSGETISDTISSNIGQTNLIAWATTAVPVTQALLSLIEIVSPGSNWRILANGSLWLGAESWPASNTTFEILTENPAERSFQLGVETLSIVPGVSLSGVGNVNQVQHQLSADAIRSVVWTDVAGTQRGLPFAIASMVSQAIPGIDFFALYEATVKAQSADLTTVDLQPADSRLPGMGKVPLRHGLPGCKVQIANGSKVLLGWKAGDPSQPYAALWAGSESVQSIQLAGNTPVARQGDGCDGGTLVFFPGTGAATLSYIPPGGTVPPPTPPTINIPLTPKINQGSSIVGCG